MSFLKMNLFAAGTAILALGAGCSGESFPDMNEDGTLPALEEIGATLSVQGSSFKAEKNVDGDPAPARVGVLWTRGLFSGGMIVQELPITGSFPDDFTIQLSPQPPADYATEDYTRGVLVVLSADATVNTEILIERDGNILGSLLPRLTADQLSALGIVSMPPVYVTHVKTLGQGDIVIDYNFSEDPLAPGYHLALFNGEYINLDYLWHDCLVENNNDESICGVRPYEQPNAPQDAYFPTILNEGDELSITVGGVHDLINTPAVELTPPSPSDGEEPVPSDGEEPVPPTPPTPPTPPAP